ncbi:MAG: uroporphyrinogen-III C-methyltransferase [Bacteroidetes bacterium]|nr:MAG: uroporphyrinogen-III C-methyltransferase [Bacteroidota bacterium]
MKSTLTNSPKLTLVGAGTGDPDLITLKAIKALKQADVVLYDALVNPELLEYAPFAKIVFVGKRVGKHEFLQHEINELIVENALRYGHVVRLKGGDPFVFGRGYEEMQYAESFGIPTNVIPGISSAIAVPELQHIPLTHRGISESFWVLTGTTKTGEISKDLHLAVQSTATVIVLMATRKLAEIAELYQIYEKSDAAVAIVQNGTLPNEKIVIGTMKNIVALANEQQIDSPAVIIIGEVVNLRKKSEQSENQIDNSLNKPKTNHEHIVNLLTIAHPAIHSVA